MQRKVVELEAAVSNCVIESELQQNNGSVATSIFQSLVHNCAERMQSGQSHGARGLRRKSEAIRLLRFGFESRRRHSCLSLVCVCVVK